MKVIGLCGMQGAGKEAAAGYIAREYGGFRFEQSGRLRERLRENGVSEIPKNSSRLFKANAGVLGYAWLAREVLDDIYAHLGRIEFGSIPEADPDAPVVVNGIWNEEEVALYRRAFGDRFRLVALHAPQILRFDRVYNRGGRVDGRNMSWDDFLAIESLEAPTGKVAAMALADIDIENGGTLDAFHAELDKLLRP